MYYSYFYFFFLLESALLQSDHQPLVDLVLGFVKQDQLVLTALAFIESQVVGPMQGRLKRVLGSKFLNPVEYCLVSVVSNFAGDFLLNTHATNHQRMRSFIDATEMYFSPTLQ